MRRRPGRFTKGSGAIVRHAALTKPSIGRRRRGLGPQETELTLAEAGELLAELGYCG